MTFPSQGTTLRLKGRPAGISTSFELALRFHLWWQQQRKTPHWRAIATHWNVDRATAYRWRNAYLAALGNAHPAPEVTHG